MRMLAFVVVVVGLMGAAAAGPKPLPAKLAKAASAAFTAARQAEKQGDLQAAWKQYERAIEIAPHPSVYFNLADVQRRAKVYRRAIRSYLTYLELVPDAPDRKAVEKLIAELRAIKGTLEITSSEPDGIVFVNGKLVGKAPIDYQVLEGAYEIDVITPITSWHKVCETDAGRSSSCSMTPRPRTDGNLVMSSTWSMTNQNWPVDKQRFDLRGRFPVKPGHYELKVLDRQCKPLPLDVPAGDVITYAYVTYPDKQPELNECIDLKIAQQRVKL
jgi:ribosomal protein S10